MPPFDYKKLAIPIEKEQIRQILSDHESPKDIASSFSASKLLRFELEEFLELFLTLKYSIVQKFFMKLIIQKILESSKSFMTNRDEKKSNGEITEEFVLLSEKFHTFLLEYSSVIFKRMVKDLKDLIPVFNQDVFLSDLKSADFLSFLWTLFESSPYDDKVSIGKRFQPLFRSLNLTIPLMRLEYTEGEIDPTVYGDYSEKGYDVKSVAGESVSTGVRLISSLIRINLSISLIQYTLGLNNIVISDFFGIGTGIGIILRGIIDEMILSAGKEVSMEQTYSSTIKSLFSNYSVFEKPKVYTELLQLIAIRKKFEDEIRGREEYLSKREMGLTDM